MPLYDATLVIHEGMLTFPGDPPFSIETVFDCRKGDPFNLALMKVGTHLGTHVDPPAHYVEGGATVDEIPLEVMVGPGVILDMQGRQTRGPAGLGRVLDRRLPAYSAQDRQQPQTA